MPLTVPGSVFCIVYSLSDPILVTCNATPKDPDRVLHGAFLRKVQEPRRDETSGYNDK